MKLIQLSLFIASCALFASCGSELSFSEAEALAQTRSLKIASDLRLDLARFSASAAKEPDFNGNWHFTWQNKENSSEKFYVTVGNGRTVDWTASEELFASRGIRSK